MFPVRAHDYMLTGWLRGSRNENLVEGTLYADTVDRLSETLLRSPIAAVPCKSPFDQVQEFLI